MRRFTRLTAGHSKKFANHCHALAIYFAFYNFVKVHSSLRISPAMAAGVSDWLRDMADVVKLIDAGQAPSKNPLVVTANNVSCDLVRFADATVV